MKKILIAATIALAATAASALELGVTAGRDYAGDNRNDVGVTLGQQYGAYNATAGVERSTVGENDQNRWSLVGGYDVAKFGSVTITPKVGVVYLDNQKGPDGYAMTVGVGASMPITQTVSVGVDIARQYGQDRVEQYNGNRATVAVKYKF
jgi:hypothetical protein